MIPANPNRHLILGLHKQGMTPSQIANQLGYKTVNPVSAFLLRHGVRHRALRSDAAAAKEQRVKIKLSASLTSINKYEARA